MTQPVIIGNATLYCGDAREILPTLPLVNLFVTSPPYGQLRDYGGHDLDVQHAVLGLCADRLTDGGVLMWNVADQTVDGSESGDSFRQALHGMSCGLRLHDTMIYCKDGVTFPDSNRYLPCFEYMFVFSNGAPAVFNGLRDRLNKWRGTKPHGTKRLPDGTVPTGRAIGFRHDEEIPEYGLRRNWWVIGNTGGGSSIHPARMPLDMAVAHVLTWTNLRQMVADPFMGSGTSGVAAVQNGRQFIGIEIERRYFDDACRRIEDAQRQGQLFAGEAA